MLKVNKATGVWLIMIAVLAAGLWVILSLGSTLRAPADVSGAWTLHPADDNREAGAKDLALRIEQSGKFARLFFTSPGEADVSDVKQSDEDERAVGASGMAPLHFSGDRLTIDLARTGGIGRGTMTIVDSAGRLSGRYDARRDTSPAGAVAIAPKPSTTAPATTTQVTGAASPPKGAPAAKKPPHEILTLLLQLVLILGLSRAMGLLFARFHQPQVLGEMLAGIMLGPSLFGLMFPHAAEVVFPAASVGYLNVLSQVGVIFFLFLIGLELDPKLLKNRGHTAVVISHVSIIAPFLLGAGLTLIIYTRLLNDSPHMRFTSVALFIGAAMSITAFPVLARILTERNLHRTNVGAVSITCAAVDDVMAWCMLAFVIGIARADGLMPGLLTAGLSLVYVAGMFFVVRPFLRRLQAVFDREGRLSQGVVAVIILLVLASAYTTEAIGIHALFGAFLLGAMMPKGSSFVRALSEKLEDYTVIFLLPIFFAFTGLKTQIGLLNSGELWLDTALIIFVACLGKFGGSSLAGRVCGLSWREAGAVGALMNTRGLMELVILTIGLQEGVITPAVFAMMVLMAIITTALTQPLLDWIYPRHMLEREIAASQKRGDKARPYRVLVPVSFPDSGAALVRLAGAIAGAIERIVPLPLKLAAAAAEQAATLVPATAPPAVTPTPPAEKPPLGTVYALHLRRPTEHEAYRSGLDEDLPPTSDPTLMPLLEAARRERINVEPDAFVSRDVPEDIARVAEWQGVDLVLIGFHKPVFGKTILGGTVHRVMSQVETDVGVFVDKGANALAGRGYAGPTVPAHLRGDSGRGRPVVGASDDTVGDEPLFAKILVPFLGGAHDRLAMTIAKRFATASPGTKVTVLHVVPPLRGGGRTSLGAQQEVSRAFEEPGQTLPVEFRLIENDSPVAVVLSEAAAFDLVLLGVSEEWGLESRLFGWRPERIARECPVPLLIVRKFAPAAAIEVPPVVTPPPSAEAKR